MQFLRFMRNLSANKKSRVLRDFFVGPLPIFEPGEVCFELFLVWLKFSAIIRDHPSVFCRMLLNNRVADEITVVVKTVDNLCFLHFHSCCSMGGVDPFSLMRSLISCVKPRLSSAWRCLAVFAVSGLSARTDIFKNAVLT